MRPLPAAGTAITRFLRFFATHDFRRKCSGPRGLFSKLTGLFGVFMCFFRSLNKLLAEPHCRSGSFDSGTAEPS